MNVTSVLLILICVGFTSSHQHGPHGGRRSGGRKDRRYGMKFGRLQREHGSAGGLYNWTRQVTEDVTVTERAYVIRATKTIYLKSKDRLLENVNIQGSSSVYDYKNVNNKQAAVKLRMNGRKFCFLIPGSIVHHGFKFSVHDITRRNVVSPTVKVEDFIMTGVGPMTRQDVKTLSTTHPTLSKFCSRSRDDRVVDIVDARTVVHADTDLTGAVPITVLTLGGKVTIYIKPSLKID
ncbi:uncharacterized protein 6-like [Haliotis cracherodii]|uniref:uncharacterized protein 6-like n=1 Tax=Haliotis cracherodii TaxID=6455 RepID=UPI0039E7A42F